MRSRLDPKEWRLLSQRQRMSPFPNYMSMEAMCGDLERYVGVALKEIILVFQDRIMNGFNLKKQFDRAGSDIVSRIDKNPLLYHKLIQLQHKWGKKLVQQSKIASKGAPEATARSLYEMWHSFNDVYVQVYASYGSVWVIEDVLNAKLLDIVKKRVTDELKSVEILNALTLQPDAMVARIERQAFYELAVKVCSQPTWRRWILNKQRQGADKQLVSLIRQHEQKYFWVTRDYEDPVITFDSIIERLKEVVLTSPKLILDGMIVESKYYVAERARLTKKLKLTSHEQALFAAMRDVAFLKELRKRYVSESLYYFDPVLEAIASKSYLSVKQVRFLRTKDVADILLRHKDYTTEVNNRITLSAWVTTKNGTEVFVGNKVEKFKSTFLAHSSKTREFIGMPVSPGVARGPVRIIMNPDECHKVKKGDIIVSIQVVPSFSAAIQRAAGLICDGGHGITTHPAILAREAGIPAIIQTRFAREVLKDGDMVEVDGYKGIARKL